MRSSLSIVAIAALGAGCEAAFTGNLNYNSPSPDKRHINMGMNMPQISARSWKRSSRAYEPSELNFTHGVASGDPFPESVILWTRVAPFMDSDNSNVTVEGDVPLYAHDNERFIQADANPICVEWKVYEGKIGGGGGGGGNSTCKRSTNETIGVNLVSSGEAYTTSDIDFTVKVDAGGLQPWTTYYYQFNVCGSDVKSPLGRTKTAPSEDQDVDEVKLAVFSCANWPGGYFNAYGNAARKDNHDYVVHLGDYIYENENPRAADGPRAHFPPRETFSLYDYRARHGQYRTDEDALLLARDFAWIPTWDDHEIANNAYRDGSYALYNTEESFVNDGPRITTDERKVNAVRAYFEWMPIRQIDMDDNLRIWRGFKLGKLLDLIVLDTRFYDRSIAGLRDNDAWINTLRDSPSRTIMGPAQEGWFYRTLSESKERGAAWRVWANQVIFSNLLESEVGRQSTDSWQSYIANRNRTMRHLYDNEIGNNIVLSGDSHQNWVADLAWIGEKEYDSETGSGSVGVEFAGTAVSSGGRGGPITSADRGSANYLRWNDQFHWQDGYYRGYFQMSVTPEKVEAQFFGTPTIATRNAWDLPLANMTVISGENHLARPVAGGRVESGALKGGEVIHTNLTLDTETGEWLVVGFEQMGLPH